MVRLYRTVQVIFFVLLSLLVGATARAQATIHVPADEPTIQAAVNAAQNGDTVLVAPGTYSENINFKGKAITVTSGVASYKDAASTILTGAADGPVVVFATNELPSAVLNGFTIQNGHASPVSKLNAGGISVNGASPTITNNIVSNNFGCGIFVYNNASPLIKNNDIASNRGLSESSLGGCMVNPASASAGAPPGVGIGVIYGGNVTIIGNVIEGNVLDSSNNGSENCGAGIEILQGSAVDIENNIIRNNTANCNAGLAEVIGDPPQKLTLVQNLFYGNSNNNIAIDGFQVFISGTDGPPYPTLVETINTIYGMGQELLLSFSASSMENNIIVDLYGIPNSFDTEQALWCASPVVGITIAYNDFYNAQGPRASGCAFGTGNIASQPLFRNSSAGDFHEQATSPTIGAGYTLAPDLPAADLDGKSRIFCNSLDMGAYEWHPTPPISLSSSSNPAQGGSPITFSAQLTGSCNVEPTGSVAFADAGTDIGSGTLDPQALATFTTSFLVVGQHNITAEYPGDFNFDPSTSSVLVQTIIGDPTSSTLSVSPNPATAFQPVTLSSTVTSPYLPPNGTVIFTANGQTVASAALNAVGIASNTVNSLGAGTYSMVANYQATTLFHASSSSPVSLTVLGAPSTTSLAASPNPSIVTQNVTFTARVTAAQGSHLPTGTVTLLDGGTVLSSGTLDASGKAVIVLSTLSAGTHAITARYGGDANSSPSSAAMSEVVGLIGTVTNLAASPNPANNGQTVTIAATVADSLSGVPLAGTVTLLDGTAVLGTAPLTSAGVATLSISTLTVGTHPLSASMAPTAIFAGGLSGVVSEVVQAYNFSISLSKTSLTLPAGDWTVLGVTVSPVGGFTGTVALTCTGAPAHSQCVFPDGNSANLRSGATTVQLAINTSDVYGWGHEISRSDPPDTAAPSGIGLLVLSCVFPLFALCGTSRVRRVLNSAVRWGLVAIALLGGLAIFQACGGKNPQTAVPGTYTISVTGSSSGSGSGSSSFQHSAILQLSISR